MNLVLNPFDKGKKPEKVEELGLDTAVSKAFSQFMKNQKLDVVLNNEQLNRCIEAFGLLYDKDYLMTQAQPGLFMTELVRLSYKAGHNDFKIVDKVGISTFMYEFEAEESNRLKFNLEGVAGGHFGNGARFCDFHVNGYGRIVGGYAHDCNFHITKYVANIGCWGVRSSYTVDGSALMFACDVRDCRFILNGDVGDLPTVLFYSYFLIKGKVLNSPLLHAHCEKGLSGKANNCVFETVNKDTYELLQGYYGKDTKKYKGNTVRLVKK